MMIAFITTVISLRRIWKKEDFHSYLYAGLLAGFSGTIIHSIFVNSLLFPLIMIYLWVAMGILDEK